MLGDTLESLALRYKITSNQISQVNCLLTTALVPGMVIYLPPLPTRTPAPPTRTPAPCGAPSNWVIYIVQQGDTLYSLGKAYGIPWTDIQRANCLTGITIHSGQSLYVPPWPPRTPSPTFPGIPTLTFPATSTPNGTPPTETPWGLWTTDTPTETVVVETSTPTEGEPPTPTPTETPTP